MSHSREENYLSDTVLTLLEGRLIRRASVLYNCGFRHVSAAQMAALGDRIRGATTSEEASGRAAAFLGRQMARLRAGQERGAPVASWCTPAESGGAGSLGNLFIEWLRKERYLDGVEADILKLVDRAGALQRFWSRFHGIHRHGTRSGENVPLSAIGGQ